jgi:hypothetical protein
MRKITTRLFNKALTLVVATSFSCVALADQADLSRIGISNEQTEFRVQAEVGAMDVETAKKKLAESLESTKNKIRNQFCDQPPVDQLCHHIPKDNTDFSELFVYMFIMAVAQDPFDIFTWQSFVGMNWPLDQTGKPAASAIGTLAEAPRVWSQYKTPRQIFDPAYQDPVCAGKGDPSLPVLKTGSFKQTGGLPLIDKNLNYVVYDIRVNDIYADYIKDNGLDSVAGQLAFAAADKEINIPLGYYDDPVNKIGGKPGSAALKTAWKIIDTTAGDDPSRYYTINGLIAVAAEDSESGEDKCIEAKLGLVGMHIMQRTQSGNGPDWTWSTFEHIDNAPVAENSRKPVDTLEEVLFDGGCQAPIEPQQSYAFFNPDCKDCETNQINGTGWKWAKTPPYAASHGIGGKYGTQVVRCWQIFEGTELVNSLWREKLQGTVWANYQSFSAQWKGANRGMMFPQGEVPRFLTNTTMETYDQYGATSSCLSCHANAVTAAGQESNFSFLLGLAARYQSKENNEKLAAE